MFRKKSAVTIKQVFGESSADFTRYSITLPSGRVVLIDDPKPSYDYQSIDIWVINSTVQVGDTPEDGFATFVLE